MEKKNAKKVTNKGNEYKETKKERELEDLLLLAFVFIGLGFGVAYTQIAAGLLIGFGIGMIFREVSKSREKRGYSMKVPLSVAAYIIILIAVYFIAMGIALIYSYAFFYPFNASYLLIIIGIIFLILYAIERKR